MAVACMFTSCRIPYVDKTISRPAWLVEESQSRQKLGRLLELTRPASTWQPHLVQLLGQHILEQGARQTLSFLQHVILKGKETLQMQRNYSYNMHNVQNCGHLVPVNKHLAPRVIDIDRWKTILVSLGFEIEQPDGFHTIDYVDVLVGDGVLESALDGMLLLLSLINSLPWNILRMAFNLMPEEAADLYSLIETSSSSDLPNQSIAEAFMSRYPDEMKQLGFRKEHRRIINKWSHPDEVQLCQTFSLVLTAIFQEGPPDIATFV